MSDVGPDGELRPEESDGRRRGWSIFGRWGHLAQIAAAVFVVAAVAFGGWRLGSNNSGDQDTNVEATTKKAATTTTTTKATPPPKAGTPLPVPLTSHFNCASIPPMPAGATNPTTAPVDFDGDGTAETLRVYQLGSVWHVRAEEVVGAVDVGPGDDVGLDDEVLAGSGPTMTAIGGATVNNDTAEEAWVKVGSGSATDIIGVLVFQNCDLQRVGLNNAPAEFPIGITVTAADGLACFGFDTGIEVFATTSNDGVTYTGTSTLYTIDLSSTPPNLVLGATANQSENTSSGAAFTALHTFHCDNLNAIP